MENKRLFRRKLRKVQNVKEMSSNDLELQTGTSISTNTRPGMQYNLRSLRHAQIPCNSNEEVEQTTSKGTAATASIMGRYFRPQYRYSDNTSSEELHTNKSSNFHTDSSDSEISGSSCCHRIRTDNFRLEKPKRYPFNRPPGDMRKNRVGKKSKNSYQPRNRNHQQPMNVRVPDINISNLGDTMESNVTNILNREQMILRSRKTLTLPEDRRGVPRATARDVSSLQSGGDRRSKRQTTVGLLSEVASAAAYNCSQVISPHATTAEAVSQGDDPFLPGTTNAGNRRMRRKWTNEVNLFIMRTYYRITKLETDMTTYRTRLYDEFTKKYPQIQVNVQRVSDQRRVIIRNGLIPEVKLNALKKEVEQELEQQTENPETAVIHQPQTPDEQQEELVFNNTNVTEIHESSPKVINNNTEDRMIQEVREMFSTTITEYIGTDPTRRPYIPRQSSSVRLAKIVGILNNTIIPHHIHSEGLKSFIDLHTIVYCAALTAAKCNGYKILSDLENETRNDTRVPWWQRRLSNKVERLRADIARLTEFSKGTASKKLQRKVELIIRNHSTHTRHDTPNSNLVTVIDTLKQKLAATKTRLNRYKKCSRRKWQNKQFSCNERKFYRDIKSKMSQQDEISTENMPTSEDVFHFWSSVWSSTKEHNITASWIMEEKRNNADVEDMLAPEVTDTVLSNIISNTHNWKGTGSDNIHNYWYKKFTCIHSYLLNQINGFIRKPETIPSFLSEGRTYLLPKGKISQDPAKYRPITCLQTIYKIITSCVGELISSHLHQYGLWAEEQKGCRKGSKGCKEQLIIDCVILKQVQRKNRNLSCCFIDYQKAFDSVPHTWLIEILRIYKIHPTLISLLKHLMSEWCTVLSIVTSDHKITTEAIKINRGIFQGDAFSPMWFCLALNPLSKLLNSAKVGYKIQNNDVSYLISHLLYMDDLKLYANSPSQLNKLISIVEMFSKDINMQFGIDKCKTINIRKGRLELEKYVTEGQEVMQPLGELEYYKYLGIKQSRVINHTEEKKTLTKEFTSRIQRICRTDLYGKNVVKAINTFAVPVLTYSFGIIPWTPTDLKALQRKIRTELTASRKHHSGANSIRMTLPREEGGRGITDLENLHNTQIRLLRAYFHQKRDSQLHIAICSSDVRYSPLNLGDTEPQQNEKVTSVVEKIDSWKRMALHGRHPNDLSDRHVDKSASNAWLTNGCLFPETEGFLVAIQDQVINTRNYQRYIIKDPSVQDDRCRKCKEKTETIQHITSACSELAQNDYLHRHNQVANIIHQHLAYKYGLIGSIIPYYKYRPEPVLESSNFKLYFDRSVITDRVVQNNRPDIIFQDKQAKKVFLIDIAVPNSHNIQNVIREKAQKYSELSVEIVRMWKANNVCVVPIVLSATGVIPKALLDSIKTLDLPTNIFATLQKAVILGTTRIVRKFLNTT